MVGSGDYMSASASSLADSQYDMVDDLSEISNDDHDTASIVSNDQDQSRGLDDDLAVDFDERRPLTIVHRDTLVQQQRDLHIAPTVSGHNNAEQRRPGSDVLDSFLSEDIDTPRQSIMPISFGSTVSRSSASHQNTNESEELDTLSQQGFGWLRVLIVTADDVPKDLIQRIGVSVVQALQPSHIRRGVLKSFWLPDTPAEDDEIPTAIVVDDSGHTEASIRLCTIADLCRNDEKANCDSPASHIIVFYATTLEQLPFGAHQEAWNVAVNHSSSPVCIYGPKIQRDDIMRYTHEFQLSPEYPLFISDEELLNSQMSPKLPIYAAGKSHHPAKAHKTTSYRTYARYMMILPVLFALFLPFIFTSFMSSPEDAWKQLSHRRNSLSAAYTRALNISEPVDPLDVKHLIPESMWFCPTSKYSEEQPIRWSCATEVYWLGVGPSHSHLIVSLPGRHHFPNLVSSEVYRDSNRHLSFNVTRLVEGVYDVSLDPAEAYGSVTLHMQTQNPSLNVTISHDYGNWLLHPKAYAKATADMGKAVGKDLVVVRHVAQTITDKFHSELHTGFSAMKNFTSVIALSTVRDIQTVASSAIDVWEKTTHAGQQLASSIGKELAVVHKNLMHYGQDLSSSLKSKIQEARNRRKAHLRKRLTRARKAAGKIEEATVETTTGIIDSGSNVINRLLQSGSSRLGLPAFDRSEQSASETSKDPVAHEYQQIMARLELLQSLVSENKQLGRRELRTLKKEIRSGTRQAKKLRRALDD